MAEFDQLKVDLNQARGRSAKAAQALAAARERLRRLATERARLARRADPQDPEHGRRSEQLEPLMAEAEREAKRGSERLAGLREVERGLIGSFAVFTDPTENITRLDDEFPLLLLPVRIETRFKTFGDTAAHRELWVRIYPDDCAIDTFEETLSEPEVRNARGYWQEIWRAGGVEDGERAAWRGLVGSHGSGRSAWIIENYQPLNLAEKPRKVSRTDVVLTIPTETALAPAERNAVAALWRAIWLAGDDLGAQQAAFNALRVAVGDPRAAELVELYRPFNLDDVPEKPLAKTDVNVSAAFVDFPQNVETKRDSWTRAPKATVLPDRFVLICYSGAASRTFIGNPVPSSLVVGPDPSAVAGDQLRPEGGGLVVPDELRWATDFNRAVDWGLGFRVPLTEAQARTGFDRILVVGLRMSAGPEEGKEMLETLIRHHQCSRAGFSVLPQGTPTNNTEGVGAGFSALDDADASFDDLKRGDLFTETADVLTKKDGQWLAELLGIDAGVLKKVRHSGGADQSEARAMHHALWPATLGYMMGTLMEPVFDDDDVENTRWFLTDFVSGRGPVPAVRIGKQPYGIMPTTAFSRISWLDRRDAEGRPAFLRRLRDVLRAMEPDWTAMAQNVSFVGKAGDAHKTLLDVVGLHPSSVEYHYRFAESIEHLFNSLNLGGLGGSFLAAIIAGGYIQSGMQLLQRLGYTGQATPDILNKLFFGNQGKLKGPLVDDSPLSETAAIRPYTADGRNYIQWLIDAAKTSLDAVRTEQGFSDAKPPSALLYLMLRHAMMLGYHGAGYTLHRAAGFLETELRAMKIEPAFVHVKQQADSSESRWQPLYKAEPRITGSPSLLMADHITKLIAIGTPPPDFGEQLRALDVLKAAPTARLERAFAEHIDCCSYRFDAWLLGLVNFQLRQMRSRRDGNELMARKGVYLGAYGWLDTVMPENKQLTTVNLAGDLAPIFTGDSPLFRDNTNGGYIHAPSLNHAVTAAVLRNGYISNASPANPQTLAVNLSSERVRLALGMLEGMRNEQSLGALLGYQLERGLHDRYNLAEVDRFIYALRKAFPLRADRLPRTRTAAGDPIQSIEARNVVDGVRLIEHIKRTGNANYPFGLALPDAGPAAAVISAEVARILDINDAVADLALAEGVHQAAQGNYDRVAATLETYTKGNYPPEPDVVRTPASGIALTHRVGLHLEPAAAAPAGATPRATGEPPLNHWVGGILPPLDKIACKVMWNHPVTDAPEDLTVTMQDLGLQPIDLLYLVRTESEQAMTELDDRVIRRVHAAVTPRPDAALSIRYMDAGTADFSVFEVAPLVEDLRTLVLRVRPLRASDVVLPNEATEAQEQAVSAHRSRTAQIKTDVDALGGRLAHYLAGIDPLLADTVTHRDDILTGIDSFITDAASRLSEAAAFGIPQAAWGFAFDWKRGQFAAMFEKVQELTDRWSDNLVQFDAKIAAHDALPAGTPDEVRFDMLHEAERFVSTSYTPFPATPAALKATLLGKRAAFVARRDQFAARLITNNPSLGDLLVDVRGLLPVTGFDSEPFAIGDAEDRVIAFAGDLASTIRAVALEVARRSTEAQVQLTAHDAAASATARVKALEEGARALLGSDFRIIPEFTLAPAQGDEWQNALSPAAQADLFQHFATLEIDLPVDEWLSGVAPVRENMRAWLRMSLQAEAFGRAEPALTAVQVPFQPGDPWLALEFPTAYTVDSDRLLYTAHYPAAFDKTAPQCGLLLDEWTEVIHTPDPDLGVATHTTGLSFNYDRPNSEPPQTMLLVTPATWDGRWQWEDVVGALNETLELAKKRAVEPVHVDASAYARFLPATAMAVTLRGITISTALAANNQAFALIQR